MHVGVVGIDEVQLVRYTYVQHDRAHVYTHTRRLWQARCWWLIDRAMEEESDARLI
jgi:hypothetical protein